jgi:hypothetical protein
MGVPKYIPQPLGEQVFYLCCSNVNKYIGFFKVP